MKKIVRSNLYFVLIILLEFLIPILFRDVYASIPDIRIRLFLSHFMCFIIPASIFIIITRNNPKEILRLNKISLKQLGMIVAIAFLCQPIMMSCSVISAVFFTNNVSTFMAEIQGSSFIVLLLLMAVMPAISEEITIRGIVLSGYDKVSDFKAAFITGIFFGIFHLDLQQFLYAAVLGIILGYVVRITNSILSSMTIHFLINGTSVVIQRVTQNLLGSIEKSSSETVSLVNLPVNEKIAVIMVYLVIAMTFGFIIYLLLKKLKEISCAKNVL